MKKCGDEGAIEAVVKAISIHINNADVCEHGCGALRNMIGDHSKAFERSIIA